MTNCEPFFRSRLTAVIDRRKDQSPGHIGDKYMVNVFIILRFLTDIGESLLS